MGEIGIPAIAGLLAIPVGVLIFVVALAVLGRRWPVAEPAPALADLPESTPYDGPPPHEAPAPCPPGSAVPYGCAPPQPARSFPPRERVLEQPVPSPWSPHRPYGAE